MVVYGDGDPKNWNNDAILIAGIVTDSYDFKRENPNDMYVSIVQLRKRNSDSRGGIQTDDDALAMDATRIGQWLRRAGFQVVPTWDDYFWPVRPPYPRPIRTRRPDPAGCAAFLHRPLRRPSMERVLQRANHAGIPGGSSAPGRGRHRMQPVVSGSLLRGHAGTKWDPRVGPSDVDCAQPRVRRPLPCGHLEYGRHRVGWCGYSSIYT